MAEFKLDGWMDGLEGRGYRCAVISRVHTSSLRSEDGSESSKCGESIEIFTDVLDRKLNMRTAVTCVRAFHQSSHHTHPEEENMQKNREGRSPERTENNRNRPDSPTRLRINSDFATMASPALPNRPSSPAPPVKGRPLSLTYINACLPRVEGGGQ